jgi:hypothetical protein
MEAIISKIMYHDPTFKNEKCEGAKVFSHKQTSYPKI